jgi:hypothetical protein
VSRSDFLNQVTHASDSWLSQPEWAAAYDPDAVLADRDVVTLGFDGSRGRAKGVADATALIGVRVSDGYAFELAIWEPNGDRDWSPPEHEVDAAVHAAFDRFDVVGFYADPTMWDQHVARWQARYLSRLKVKATGGHAVRFPKNQMNRVVASLKSLHSAIVSRELRHDGSPTLGAHVVNARRKTTSAGIFVGKEHPSSDRKVDGAYALMLAWQARLDALAAGLGAPRAAPQAIRRIR